MPSHQSKLTNFFPIQKKGNQGKTPMKKMKKTNDIKAEVNRILNVNSIKTRAEFLTWSSQGGRKGYNTLYEIIKNLQPDYYNSIQTPNDSIRYYAQKQLRGYKKFNK